MNDKALVTLEFNKIAEMLRDRAVSPMAKEMSMDIKPSVELYDINNQQKETTEAVSMILKKGSLPLGGIKDIRATIIRAEMCGVLSIRELREVGDFLYVCKKVMKYGVNDGRQEVHEKLDPQFQMIQTANFLESEILRCIMNEQDLYDDASNKLREIRRGIKSANDKIKDHLNSIIHSQQYKNMLQDNVVTIRSGRYCIPVKAEYRNSFGGMIHDQSSTGATLFMEPSSVVTLNNKIKELAADEIKEVEKILRMLTGIVADNAAILQADTEILMHLDFVFAKGELSLSMNGTEPIFNTNGIINITKARHPLLPNDKVVPIDIRLGDKFNILLITGPNTGGKTVSLKTLGLFTLMGQAGLHIPAFDNSELAVFDNVFADIGDEQSIEQSLSTFSGHMTNIVKILQDVTPYSLVLLDELGAGTDPTEGAALAIAIIEYLFKMKTRTAITTHYSELKVYALSTEGVENASCEFDVSTLRPTYKLLIGIPGKSNAFAISQRIGLPDFIIEHAKSFLSGHDVRFEDVITDLEISKKSVILEQQKAEQFRKEAEKLKVDFENQKQKLVEQRDKLILQAKNDAKYIIEKAKDESTKIIKQMQELSISTSNFKELEENRRKLKEIGDTLAIEANEISKPQKQEYKKIGKDIIIGERVIIISLMQSGEVMSKPDANGDLTVQSGIIKMKTNIKDLAYDETPKKEENKNRSMTKTNSLKSPKSLLISSEVDLRGLMVLEALEKLDKYLDDAALSGLGAVSIIHGKGTGALRNAVTEHLRHHQHIKTYRLGKFGEGETGITIAELK